MLPPPNFHHLHLNSVDPDRAIEFYTRQFATTVKASWGGFAALKSPNDVLVLFTKVDTPPAMEPQSAIWHFGWHVTDARRCLEAYKSRPKVKLLPLYTTDEGGAVFISSDTWPSVGGVLGLTRAQIAEAKANGVKPAGGGGFSYMRGPDNALVEYAGNHPEERFNHVHLYQEDPIARVRVVSEAPECTDAARLCAGAGDRAGRQARPRRRPHLAGAEPRRHVPLTARRRRIRRRVDDVVRKPERGPLVGSRGQLQDHIALSVADLDAWADKLEGEGVTFLEPIYPLGDTRALMIEGPSREAIELVEVK